MRKTAITAVIIAKNEAEMLRGCLSGLSWCDSVLLIDNGSTDETASIAENFGAKIIQSKHLSFDKLRTDALKYIQTPWVFYIDADERVTPQLAKSIAVHLETATPPTNAFSLIRQNIFYGHKMKWGGWQDDRVTRIFRLQTLTKWKGKVHESPVFVGQTQHLPLALIHLTHRNTTDGLSKTMVWTKIEAELLFSAGVKPVTVGTIIRKMVMEFWRRSVVFKGWKDGQVGFIEAIVQGINKALIYIQIWELQQKPSLKETYTAIDADLSNKWQTASLEK